VTTTETRLHLIEQRAYGEKGEDAGGGGASMKDAAALDEEGVRKDFRASAYWNPAIATNDSGFAEVAFKLPDNITAFKAMAVAQTLGSEFGEGDASFAVAKPVLLQPSLPRFARTGDTFEAGVVVMNATAAARSVTVKTNASGIRIRGTGPRDHIQLHRRSTGHSNGECDSQKRRREGRIALDVPRDRDPSARNRRHVQLDS
jgi:uncharacterized protein YfaS (alpha-2-macroglobulin family)